MTSSGAPADQPSPIRRVLANIRALLAGKAGAGLVSLLYLVIAARTLGAHDYGVLILVHGYILLVSGIIAFSGWSGMVRYGSDAHASGDTSRFMRLVRFMLLIELSLGILAMLVAAGLAPLVGPSIGWPPEAVAISAIYSLSIVATMNRTASGILQIGDRFDLLGWQQLVQPLSRLIGTIIVALAGAELLGFLLVWLLSALLDSAVMWTLMLRTLRRLAPGQPLRGSIAGVRRENEDIVSFITITNVDITLRDLAPKAVPLVVGALLGPAATGIYSLAQRASTVFQQPATLLTQAGYTVIVRLLAAGDHAAVRRVVWQGTLLPLAIAAPILILIALFAREIMLLLGGSSFEGGVAIVVLLAAARAVGLGRPSFGAALSALGRPSRSILVSIVTNIGMLPLLPVLILAMGLDGVGWHALVQALVATVAIGIFFQIEIARAERGALQPSKINAPSELAEEEMQARPDA